MRPGQLRICFHCTGPHGPQPRQGRINVFARRYHQTQRHHAGATAAATAMRQHLAARTQHRKRGLFDGADVGRFRCAVIDHGQMMPRDTGSLQRLPQITRPEPVHFFLRCHRHDKVRLPVQQALDIVTLRQRRKGQCATGGG